MLKRLSLGLAAAAALTFTVPANAGNGPHGYWHYHGPFVQYYVPPPVKRQKVQRVYRNTRENQRAAEIRKECRMFAFGPWRYHPDYQHCRYY